MKNQLTRRSFMQETTAGLAGVALAGLSPRTAAGSVVKKANKLALFGGSPVRQESFSQIWPVFDDREERALLKALRSGNWCCLRGNAVYDFEKTFSDRMGVTHCTLSNGGTTALGASLQCLGVGAGDEVITTPHTFIATINVMCNLHALPVYVDVDPDTGSINADLIEAAITEHTKAIVPVHLGGWPVDIEKVMQVADKHGIPVVEDACQSVFAEVNGKKVGTFGATGCISFQEWKTLVCGEGGAILGSDPELMRRCAAFVNNGRDPQGQIKGYPFAGSNHRMTEFQAAILTEQYKRFLEQDEIRQRHGQYLESELCRIPGLSRRKRYTENTRITYFNFEVDYDRTRMQGVPAARFAEALRAEGIPMQGGPRVYSGGCHREGMLEQHLNSRGFQTVFSKARLDHYRTSLDNLPVMDRRVTSVKEMIKADTKIALLGSREDVDHMIAAFRKVAAHLDQLA
ncbi:MAG: DegT/DnrJ/EryC1/StrS family aminotransferase [Phycisphaerae bacterium]|nr:DegT/DnrJ/EryC1/StrS family aminotransferase [Phycisphaerae bacterium]